MRKIKNGGYPLHKSTPSLGGNGATKTLIKKSIYHLSTDVKPEIAFLLGKAAHDAAVGEIPTRPKPGLVDPLGQGCHRDMDWTTLMTSAEALAPFWREQALTGLDGIPPADALAKLRAVGIEMDIAMLAATRGINAHKGLVYIMSLLLYGAGYAIYKGTKLTADTIATFAAETVKGCVAKDLLPLKSGNIKKPMTHGEKLFFDHGVTGIRGEAENAFPSITQAGLPELRRARREGANENDAAILALLAIMEVSQDSNVIYRGGFSFWKNEYKAMVAETRRNFSHGVSGYAPITALEEKFRPLRVSPGGAADLLACTLFLNFVTFSTCQQ